MKTRYLFSVLVLALIVSGCSRSSSAQSYPRNQTRTAYDVEFGEVLSTRTVEIEGDTTGIGIFGGSQVGQAIGSTVNSRSRRRLARAVGGVAWLAPLPVRP